MTASIQVAIGDDDEATRHALATTLDGDPRFDVVGQAATGPSLVELVAHSRPQVALVDVRMPGGGAEAVRSLLAGPPVVVVAVTAETHPRTVAELLDAGVTGYLVKGRLGACLPDLVARCAQGEVVVAAPTAAEALRRLLSARRP